MIIYKGPSMLDGKPIVAIATGLKGSSSNRKTGGMVQTWILPADVEPHKAVKTGADATVCGDCPHRPIAGGSCYVTVHQAPLSVHRAWKRGRYPALDVEAFRDQRVRFGAWGDPAAVPVEIWQKIATVADGHTGYTHQWRNADPRLARYCMASVDDASERDIARAMGWRCFRTRLESEQRQQGEAICPASVEAGHKLNCETCMACGGANGRKGDIVIVAHGSAGKVANYKRARVGADGKFNLVVA